MITTSSHIQPMHIWHRLCTTFSKMTWKWLLENAHLLHVAGPLTDSFFFPRVRAARLVVRRVDRCCEGYPSAGKRSDGASSVRQAERRRWIKIREDDQIFLELPFLSRI